MAEIIDIQTLLTELQYDAERAGYSLSIDHKGGTEVEVKPQTIKRCLNNLITNAIRHGKTVTLTSERLGNWWLVDIEDDGPGIPEEEWEAVFRPFYRLDTARNQDSPSTGLGLSIARDIARAHGGEIRLGRSAMGGLKATLRLPT